MDGVAIVPAYKPDDRLPQLVSELHDNGLGVLVIDDGSGEEYQEFFARTQPFAVVLTHNTNRGKGAALKTGISAFKEYFPDCSYFITADSDGQHRIEDILRVRDELTRGGARMVLSTRRFKSDMPFRSRIGNTLSRLIYTILTGHYLTDNQSGLRGFAVSEASWLTEVGGDKYDYELNMLYWADKQRIPITTLPIEAVYIDGNSSSHFDPIADTLRIYKRLFKSATASFISLIVAELAITVISFFIGYRDLHITLPSVGLLSAVINLLINRTIIFRHIKYADGARIIVFSVLRYIAYTVGCLLLSLVFMPPLPLLLSYNICLVIGVPCEYLLHKILHYGKYGDINRS